MFRQPNPASVIDQFSIQIRVDAAPWSDWLAFNFEDAPVFEFHSMQRLSHSRRANRQYWTLARAERIQSE